MRGGWGTVLTAASVALLNACGDWAFLEGLEELCGKFFLQIPKVLTLKLKLEGNQSAIFSIFHVCTKKNLKKLLLTVTLANNSV